MRILLPPSEGKAAKGRGYSLARRGLEGPLSAARLAVLQAVSAWCAGDPAAAAAGLGLPPSTADVDLAVNVRVLDAPTMPAIDRFQGVVFDGLGVASMDAAQRRTVLRTVLIASGAFGLLGAGEPVPDHRVPMAATVPSIGGLTPYWRKQLVSTIPDMGRQLVVDLRSTDYLATPPVADDQRKRVLAVKVLTERAGSRSVVSYSSKLTKGQLARALIEAEAKGDKVRTPADVAEIAAAAGFRVEPGRAPNGQPTLDLVLQA
ncbi:peroxide stress protein YaaA [Acidothermaceae bacterium B102]|nr:peroxide stress protein YaaA [Acidothermaceae bacterium B102]